MARKQLNIRLDALTHEILKAIAEAIGDDPKLPPSDVTALVKKALKLYIEEFRRDEKYQPVIERAEMTAAEKGRQANVNQTNVIPIPVERKPPKSAASLLPGKPGTPGESDWAREARRRHVAH